MLLKRLITSLIGIPFIIFLVWVPFPYVFAVSIVVVTILASIEYFTLVSVRALRGLFFFGIIFSVLLVLRPYCTFEYSLPALIGAGLICSLLVVLFHRKTPGVFVCWGWMLLGTLYIGWFMSLLVAMRISPVDEVLGRNLVLLVFFATFGNDTLAYFVGKSLGRHKMSPRISPKKTWEGAAGGLVGAVIVCIVFTLDTPFQVPFTLLQAAILGILLSVFAQFGDFAESALKRFAGVKDSGNLMPGHGGALDRLDSLLLAGGVVYYFYLFALA